MSDQPTKNKYEVFIGFKNPEVDRSVLLDTRGVRRTQTLFVDVNSNKKYKPTYSSVFRERTILQKVNKFKNILDQNLKALPAEIKEDLDTHFSGILSVIRNFRNQSGHPTGKIMDREQTFVLLQLFVPYCKKLYQMNDYFQK